jgi:hypothetical protein
MTHDTEPQPAPPTRIAFRDRIAERRRVQKLIEDATQPKDWRVLLATGGRCAHCHEKFVVNDPIMWHVRIRETLHFVCG